MKVAFAGTGYVSDAYARDLQYHSDLELVGAYDCDPGRLEAFTRFATKLRPESPPRQYSSLNELLADEAVETVVNLTNPRSHAAVTRQSLEAGKHVYSEKPLGMNLEEARSLAFLAKERNLRLSSAPCSFLSPAAQTLAKAVRDGTIGTVRVVYANFDDGMIAPKMTPWGWLNEFGIPWPAKDEFEVGCTVEHAGYFLTWLAGIFGPAREVTAFASCCIPDKGIEVEGMAPDFTAACLRYDENVVVRATCGLVAPLDKSLTIVGDKGVLFVKNLRDDYGGIYLRHLPATGWQARIEPRVNRLRRRLERLLPFTLWSSHEWALYRKIPQAIKEQSRNTASHKPVDFCRGLAEMAEAIQQGRTHRLSADLGFHIVELINALQNPAPETAKQKISSSFDPIEPLA
ncbi:MAG: Gfo/Idh/MocA family oxidoreductase [Opitutales bacterium]|nr:Gfo/Idh/MocA family oxidoreductase [Opitutales bacterium]